MSVTSTVASAIKHNTNLFDRMRKAVVGESAKLAAVASAATLYSAMDAYTVHDTSNAAAHWDLQINGSTPSGSRPDQIPSSPHGVGPRYSAGAYKEDAIAKKAQRYGFNPVGGSKVVEVPKGSWLFNAVKGSNPQISLFNPVGGIPRYKDNAFPDIASFTSQVRAMALGAGNGYKPIFIRNVSQEIGIPVRTGL